MPLSAQQAPLYHAAPKRFSDLPLQPALAGVIDALPALSVALLRQVDSFTGEAAANVEEILERRARPRWWSLQRLHVVERALFFEPFAHAQDWKPGPNRKVPGNVFETAPPWLRLSGGTDWTGFQGCFRQLPSAAERPRWASFRVQVSSPDLSGAFLVLAGGKHSWGLEDLVLLFNYRGADGAEPRRCFTVQTRATQHGGKAAFCDVGGVRADQPYNVAVRFDWEKATLSLFIDGQELVHEKAFDAEHAIRYAALYSWRSSASSAFSEISLGDADPQFTPGPGAPPLAQQRHLLGTWPPSREWLYFVLVTVLVVLVAFLIQFVRGH